jgi:uncharacterized protein (TIGR02118 family)
MHKLIVLYPQPTDPRVFMEYYETRHIPHVAELPGLLSYSYGRVDVPQAEYFLVFEAVFADQNTLQAAVDSNAGHYLTADIPNYSPAGATVLTLQVQQ